MDSIRRALADPAWWLSVVVVAILIAPIQKWVTDLFYSIAAKSSTKWAERKSRKAAEEHNFTLLLACDQTMLIMEAILTFAMVSIAFYLDIYAFVSQGETHSQNIPKFLVIFNAVAKGLTQVCSFILFFFASRRFMRLFNAYLAYRKLKENNLSEIRAAMAKKAKEDASAASGPTE